MNALRRLLPALAAALLVAQVAAQDDGKDEPLVIQSSGSQYAFADEQDPDLAVLVIVGGVELVKGPRRMLADTLVVVVDTAARGASGEPAADASQVIPSAEILEIYVDGNVTIEEGDELVAGAEAAHLDNRTDQLTLLDGSWHANLRRDPLVVRFGLMRSFADGRREIEGALFTTCEYAHAHWGLETPWALVEPTEAGRILKTSRSVVQVGDVPLLPLAGLHYNLDRDRPPLRRVSVGDNSRYGTAIETEWGGDASDAATDVASWFDAGPAEADWNLEISNFSDRGVFLEPSVTYATETSFGQILGASIHDDEPRDHLDTAIEDDTRGRFDLKHRTRIGDHRVVDVEISHLSDRSFLKEYYESELRNEKDQETYVNWRDVRDNVAVSVLARARLNNFQTQVEQLPQVERRVVGEVFDAGPLEGVSMTGREFVSHARLMGAEPPADAPGAPAGSLETRNLRVGSRRILTWPVELGGDKLNLSAGWDVTGFDRSRVLDATAPGGAREDNQGVLRHALLGGAAWSRTYSGADSAYASHTWNFDGVRQVVEPLATFDSVLELSRRPPGLIAIDDVEALDKLQVFSVGLRHRVQTHQRDRVVTVLDSQVSLPLLTNEERDNAGDTMGDALLDTRWTPGARIWGLRQATVAWRMTVDPNERWSYVKSYASYSTRIGDAGRIVLANNKAAGASNFATAGVEWELTPKWSSAFFVQQDLLLDESARRGIILRQRAHRWLIDVELSQRRAVSTLTGSRDLEEEISVRFRPAIFAHEDDTLLERVGDVRR